MELDATIAAIHQETPTVKSFLLDLMGASLRFLPGQYVDMVIESPWAFETGGFSITSSPVLTTHIQIAVKRLPDRSASIYLNDRAQVGDEVLIMGAGGDFFFQEGMADSLVLVAGGIGITPLMSIVRYVDEAALNVPVTLLYSASNPSELIFRQQLEAVSEKNPRLRCLFTITRPELEPWEGRVGRIDRQMLEENIPDKNAKFYLCGPRGMPENITRMLLEMGVPDSSIKSEQW